MALSIGWLSDQKAFPHATLYNIHKNSYKWDFAQLRFFYTSRGYFIYRVSSDKFYPIRVIDNIVKQVGKKDLADEILNFLVDVENIEQRPYSFAIEKIKDAVSDDILLSLPEKQVEFRKDKKDAIQLYFQNCIVKITETKITTHPYSDLNGFIWESQILNREYIQTEVNGTSDFAKFIFNLANKEESRANSICSAFGFYLHNYKSPAYCPAIVLNDEVISDNPEGRTGKGMFFKAVGKFIKTLKIDGKSFKFDKNFLYQRVTADTKLIFFDDVRKNFDFEMLFSVITEGIGVEKKGKDEVYYEHADSPKAGLTTNYAIRGTGSSHDARRFELEISQHYNKQHTPLKEFGRMMFDEWPKNEWIQFDNYMIQCCQLYLKNGLIEQNLINLPEKRMLAEISSEFSEFIEDNLLQPGESIQRVGYYKKFKDQYNSSRIASRTFYSMLHAYCDFHKIVCHEQKSNGIMMFVF
jgi:hypothetical protein